LADRLSEPALRQLKQRIALRCELQPFDLHETASYVAGRLRIAGGSPEAIFTRDALLLIYEATKGVPRTINVLCDNALIGGFAEQVKPVNAKIVREVAKDFDFHESAVPAPHAEPKATAESAEPPARPLGAIARAKKRFSFFCLIPLLVLVHIADVAAAQSKPAVSQPVPRPAVAAAGATLPSGYVIGSEDVLGIVFWRDTDMTGDVTVRPDGKITLPLIGEIYAVGLTPETLREVINTAASKFLEDSNVTVVVRQINSRKAFITGEVRTPGAYPLTSPRTVMQLIALAGGLSEYADAKNITIMRNEKGQTRTLKFNYKDVSKGKNVAQNIELNPGDTVVVP
jgi:polysaccharide export outer membrane protein